MRFANSLVGIGVLAVLVAACQPSNENDEMIEGFRSGASLAATRTLITQRGLEMASKVEQGPGERKDVTRVRAEVDDFEAYRQRGTLILGFYNDQLVRVEFRPADMAAFLSAYQSSTGVDLRAERERRGEIEVFLYESAVFPPSFVGWEDTRLRERLFPID